MMTKTPCKTWLHNAVHLHSTGNSNTMKAVTKQIIGAYTGNPHSPDLSHSMAAFKHFLDTRGRPMAADPTFLSFFALPYIHHPQTHPSFHQLFTPQFASQLKSQLRHFLQSIPDEQSLPELYTMYRCEQSCHSTSCTCMLSTTQQAHLERHGSPCHNQSASS